MMTIIEQSMRTHILVQKSIIISPRWITVSGKGGKSMPRPYDHLRRKAASSNALAVIDTLDVTANVTSR